MLGPFQSWLIPEVTGRSLKGSGSCPQGCWGCWAVLGWGHRLVPSIFNELPDHKL